MVSDADKTRAQLLSEVRSLRERVARLEPPAGLDEDEPTGRPQQLLGETLAEVTLALTVHTSRTAVLDEIMHQVQRIVPSMASNIALVEGDVVRTVRWRGYDAFGAEEMISHLVQLLDEFPIDYEVIHSREPVVLRDTHASPRWVTLDETAWVRSHIVIPVCMPDRVLGLLRLDSDRVEAFSEADARLLMPFASVAAVALEQAQLYESLESELAERRQAEEMYRTLAVASPDGVAVIDREARIAYASPSLLEMHGFVTAEALIGTTAFELIVKEERQKAIQQFQSVLSYGGVAHGRYTLLRADGSTFDGEIRGAVITDEQGQVRSIISTTRDVSERERARRMVERSEERLRQRNRELELLNHAGQAFNSTLDLDQVLIAVLEEVRYLLDVVATSVWLVDPEGGGLTCYHATGPASGLVRGWRLASDDGIVGWVARRGESLIVADAQQDQRHFLQIGQQIGVSFRSILSVPLQTRAGVIGVLQILDTETDRFGLEDLTLIESIAATAAIAIDNARLFEQARQDAATKATLLKEVNHRVKNNLSAIIGLLYVERNRANVENPSRYRTAMDELVSRVRSLSIVYQMLSASEWAPLFLRDLVLRVASSTLHVLPDDKRVDIHIAPSSARVTPEQAHNLALVVNELTLNTVKYALEGSDEAVINVRIGEEDEWIDIVFEDDGPGLPEPVLTTPSAGTGFELIANVVRRTLRGVLELENDEGAVITVRFPNQV